MTALLMLIIIKKVTINNTMSIVQSLHTYS